MNEGRRRRIDDICDGALDCDPAARGAFVDAACGTDAGLRRDVQALLAHADSAEHYLAISLDALAAEALADDRRTSLIGRQVGDYRILALLGSGGMGDVYQATDVKLGRRVAIKVLPAAFAADADRVSRFQREAHVLASLNHPNIAHIYGLVDCGETPCIVMEFVEGETLQARLAHGPLPVEDALAIARQIADALEAAHGTHVVHRDLKPGNIMVARDGTVKVLDFGLAKDYAASLPHANLSNSPTAAISPTSAGVILGTAAYMSPEQARGKPVDKRTDIWAFGCVLYELIIGKPAFHGEDTTDILASVVKSEPDVAAIPAQVRPLVRRCLEKDPQRRLRDIGDAMSIVEHTPESPAGTRRHWAPWAVTAAVLILLGALSVIHFREQLPAVPAPMRFQIPAPDNKGSYDFGAAISPDGRKVAFLRQGRLWVHSLETGESHDVTDMIGTGEIYAYTIPFWSPDSRFIGVAANGKLKKIEAMGTLAQTVCDLAVDWFAGSWNQDDVIIFATYPGPVFKVPAAGGVPVPVTALDASRQERTHEWPWFLPDGRHFLYVRRAVANANSYYVGSLNLKPEEQSTTPILTALGQPVYAPSADPRTGYLLFTREDGSLMAQPFDNGTWTLIGEPVPLGEHVRDDDDWQEFSVSANGVLVFNRGAAPRIGQLTWFDRQGKVLGTVGDRTTPSVVRISPDGTQAATVRGGMNPDIWVLELARGTSIRLTSDGGDKGDPVWSPDGHRIAFRKRGSGLVVKPSNGSGAEEVLFKSVTDVSPLSWSPDGRFLLYGVTDPRTRNDVWVLPLDGDRAPGVALDTEFNEINARFSPDGRWIAYSSDESGKFEVYVRSFEPPSGKGAPVVGARRVISTNGGNWASWRSDGKELYYASLDAKLMAVEIATSPVFRAGSPHMFFPPLKPPPLNRVIGGDLTADGQRALLRVSEPLSEPYRVVLNWPALLKH